MDLITSLHDTLIETILLELPLQDAARTCILSTRWRHCWLKLPHLKLGASFWKQSMQSQIEAEVILSNITSQVLSLHQGSITYFILSIPQCIKNYSEIDALISFVVRNGVQHFILQFDVFEGNYKVPSSIFTCPNLKTLILWCCNIDDLPSCFGELRLLTCLVVGHVTISHETLKTLISSCKGLVEFEMRMPIDIRCHEFKFSKLQKFSYYRKSPPKISPDLLQVDGLPNQAIHKFFDAFPCIQKLHFNGRCLKDLVEGGVPMSLSRPLLHLKSIGLRSIRLENEGMLSCVLCLIKSSPNLQKLKLIVVRNYSSLTENLQQEQQDNSWKTCSCLLAVKMEGVGGGRAEMKLINLLLSKSPALKKMSIKLGNNKAEENIQIKNELFQFKHASSNVTINIID